MVNEAEKYKNEDKEQRDRIGAKYSLESAQVIQAAVVTVGNLCHLADYETFVDICFVAIFGRYFVLAILDDK